jgi:hypothetical protein
VTLGWGLGVSRSAATIATRIRKSADKAPLAGRPNRLKLSPRELSPRSGEKEAQRGAIAMKIMGAFATLATLVAFGSRP